MKLNDIRETDNRLDRLLKVFSCMNSGQEIKGEIINFPPREILPFLKFYEASIPGQPWTTKITGSRS